MFSWDGRSRGQCCEYWRLLDCHGDPCLDDTVVCSITPVNRDLALPSWTNFAGEWGMQHSVLACPSVLQIAHRPRTSIPPVAAQLQILATGLH